MGEAKGEDVTMVEPNESVVEKVTRLVEVNVDEGVKVDTESEDVTIVDPSELVVEYTTVFVEAEGVGEGVNSDLKVLVERKVDPLESVAV